MKLFRVIFLILFFVSPFVFAQTSSEKPQAIKIEEFGKLYNGDMRARFDYFFSEVYNTAASKGLIVIYGTGRESGRLEMFFKNYARFRGVDLSKLEVIKAGYRSELLTQFWNVPAGAETPTLEPTARKFDEFGEAAQGDIKARMDSFFNEIKNNPNARAYLINYGTNRKTVERERYIKNYTKIRTSGTIKIDFAKSVNKNRIKTVLWIIPDGAEVPTP